jgi:hypothetical protein
MALLPPVPYCRVSYEDLNAKVSFSLRRRFFFRARALLDQPRPFAGGVNESSVARGLHAPAPPRHG